MAIQHLPVSKIRAGNNDRKLFNQQKLKDLAHSISAHGLIAPPLLRPMPDGMYEIIAGERRVRAMRDILKWREIPAYVQPANDESASALTYIENASRVDLDAMTESDAIQQRIETFGWSIEYIAKSFGVSKWRIDQRLKLQNLSAHAQDQVRCGLMPVSYADKMTHLDTNRQYFALQVWRDKPRMPMHAWVAVCRNFYNEQKAETQEDFFHMVEQQSDLVDMICAQKPNGRQARTGAQCDLGTFCPELDMSETPAEMFDAYIAFLQDEGKEEAAGAMANVYNAMVARRFISVEGELGMNGSGALTVGEELDSVRRKRYLLQQLAEVSSKLNGSLTE